MKQKARDNKNGGVVHHHSPQSAQQQNIGRPLDEIKHKHKNLMIEAFCKLNTVEVSSTFAIYENSVRVYPSGELKNDHPIFDYPRDDPTGLRLNSEQRDVEDFERAINKGYAVLKYLYLMSALVYIYTRSFSSLIFNALCLPYGLREACEGWIMKHRWAKVERYMDQDAEFIKQVQEVLPLNGETEGTIEVTSIGPSILDYKARKELYDELQMQAKFLLQQYDIHVVVLLTKGNSLYSLSTPNVRWIERELVRKFTIGVEKTHVYGKYDLIRRGIFCIVVCLILAVLAFFGNSNIYCGICGAGAAMNFSTVQAAYELYFKFDPPGFIRYLRWHEQRDQKIK